MEQIEAHKEDAFTHFLQQVFELFVSLAPVESLQDHLFLHPLMQVKTERIIGEGIYDQWKRL